MSKGKDEIIEGHEYDGIRELDNPLPRWWLAIFFLTIVFAVFYYYYFEIKDTPSSRAVLQERLAELEAKQAELREEAPEAEEINVAALLEDEQAMNVGQEVYIQTCASCHGQKGEGLIGPNLTDPYWIHSKGSFEGILTAIREGFPDKGMPPWNDVIPVEKHYPLAAYVMSLQGTNPENAKGPEGELVNE